MMKQNENETNFSVPLEIIKASEIEPREVKWLWYPYIPFGKVTLLQGDPGDGKSKLMLSIAALLSKGEPLPFTETEENEPMAIIYQTTEDDADDTVVPRFNSADGNGENLIFIKEDEKTLSFGDNRIREAIEMYNAKLLILDPLSSYIGENCSMNNANETRAEFNHLIAVAKDTGCAIVIIAHMNKMKDNNPLYRTNGSIDIAGAARSILAITRTPNKEAPAERYLVQVKSNLAPTGSAILFEVAEKGWKYVYGGSNPNTSFDCSGLVQWCYGKAGISLPRTAQAQYDATQHLPLSQAKAGDLVFFHSTYNAGSYVTHVGIYVGNNQMYHAGDPIGYADLSSSYWQQHLIGAGRVKQ